MRHAVRSVSVLATALVLGGCVGYGYPGNPYGYGQGQPYPGDYGNGGYGAGNTFRCESHGNRIQRCSADTRYGVRISRRLSDAPCVPGRTWGWDAGGVWVDQGCRAEFVTGGGDGSSYPGGGYGQERTVRCESQQGRLRHCDVVVYGGARIQRKLSDSPCIQGSTWGWDRNGIWVDRGCRAEFLVY